MPVMTGLSGNEMYCLHQKGLQAGDLVIGNSVFSVGFIGGILSGVGGYSGVLPTIWTQLRGWPKQMARAVYQPYIIVIQLATVIGIILASYDRAGLVLVLLVLPPLALGTWIGWQLYGKLNDRRFRQALAVLLIASGITLVV